MNEEELLRPMTAYEQKADEEELERTRETVESAYADAENASNANKERAEAVKAKAEETMSMVDPETVSLSPLRDHGRKNMVLKKTCRKLVTPLWVVTGCME